MNVLPRLAWNVLAAWVTAVGAMTIAGPGLPPTMLADPTAAERGADVRMETMMLLEHYVARGECAIESTVPPYPNSVPVRGRGVVQR